MKRILTVCFTLTTLLFGAGAWAADKAHRPNSSWTHDNRPGSDRGHHGGHDGRWNRGWDHRDHGSSSHFSFHLGVPLYWYPYSGYSYYRSNPYYYNPYPGTVVIERQPPVYVQQTPPPAQQSTSSYWFFCPDTKTYYPYTQTCPSNWLQVVPPTSP